MPLLSQIPSVQLELKDSAATAGGPHPLGARPVAELLIGEKSQAASTEGAIALTAAVETGLLRVRVGQEFMLLHCLPLLCCSRIQHEAHRAALPSVSGIGVPAAAATEHTHSIDCKC